MLLVSYLGEGRVHLPRPSNRRRYSSLKTYARTYSRYLLRASIVLAVQAQKKKKDCKPAVGGAANIPRGDGSQKRVNGRRSAQSCSKGSAKAMLRLGLSATGLRL